MECIDECMSCERTIVNEIVFGVMSKWLNRDKYSLGTVCFYLKFLFFVVQEKGGEGVEATENGKLVEKPEENGVGGGVYKHKTWGIYSKLEEKMVKIYQIFFISFQNISFH